ncbi:MAG TPA: CYCXC family (seleno)protein [Candidatus Binataceae bacterium]|nr:CYCXC family (seleno)protein [Candidatus Binataceae bacterium]
MSESGKARIDSMVVVVIMVVMAIAIYAGASVYRSHTNDSAPSQQPITEAAAAQNVRLTLDPNQFVGDVKKAYQIAEHDPALLVQLHCWCGCDRTDGHKNLLDCYRDTHGAHCAICTGEAIEAEKLANQGMSVEKIRDALRDRFANGD